MRTSSAVKETVRYLNLDLLRKVKWSKNITGRNGIAHIVQKVIDRV